MDRQRIECGLWELRRRTENTLRTYRSQLGVVGRWLEGEGIDDVDDVHVAHLRGSWSTPRTGS